MKKFLCGLCIALCPFAALAQMTVVRVDGNKVYLDTSDEKTPLTKGSTFKVILSSEKLTNPQTGKDLGEIYHYSEPGVVTEVQPLYVVGELPKGTQVTVGKQAVPEGIKPAAVVAAVPTEQPLKSTRAVTVYDPVEQTVISITQADVTQPGAQNILTLSDKNEITVFSRTGKETLKPEISYKLPAGKKGLFISAAVVDGKETAVFVPVYTENATTINTLVLANRDGKLEQVATLPYFSKELGCGTDKKIWAQRPFVLGSNPGNARQVAFEKNKFVASGATFNTRHNWLAGLNFFPIQNAEQTNLITTVSNGVLRLFLTNGKTAESKDKFASSPLRVTYKQEILKFYPSVQVFGEPGQATLAAVENGAKLGLLSKTFGQYQAGKIHFLQYEKGSLKITDTVELDGVIYDTSCTERAILTAEVLPDGTSRVVEILK